MLHCPRGLQHDVQGLCVPQHVLAPLAIPGIPAEEAERVVRTARREVGRGSGPHFQVACTNA